MSEPVVGKVREAFSGRLLCVIVGNEIRERRRGPVVGTICGDLIYREPRGDAIATMRGRFLMDAETESQGVLASIGDGDILVDGELVATYEGDWSVGIGGAAYLFAL